jgi:phytoene dehydrogenase-like protein
VTPARTDVVVVGGGIAGLAAAHALQEAGRDALLLEASSRFGGVILTEKTGGFVVEAGPDSILAQKPRGARLSAARSGWRTGSSRRTPTCAPYSCCTAAGCIGFRKA